MKSETLIALALTCVFATVLNAATPEQEKEFVDRYKAASEASDKATLETFLYTKGAHPEALEFYKEMLADEMGQKITKIELRDLTPEEANEAEKVQEGPGGEKIKLPVKATKLLEVTIETKGEEGSSTSSSGSMVGEVDGKLFILVPAVVK